nr:hypothetical protein [Candidatus Sigynarchaeota archaeon]
MPEGNRARSTPDMTTRETYRDEDIQIFHTEGHVFKVIVVGDAEVGKTSLIRSHTKAKFDSSYHTTVGVNIAKETMTVTHKSNGGNENVVVSL